MSWNKCSNRKPETCQRVSAGRSAAEPKVNNQISGQDSPFKFANLSCNIELYDISIFWAGGKQQKAQSKKKQQKPQCLQLIYELLTSRQVGTILSIERHKDKNSLKWLLSQEKKSGHTKCLIKEISYFTVIKTPHLFLPSELIDSW